ncbi:MAG: response regulator transcription factor [Caldilineaceae bacterium]
MSNIHVVLADDHPVMRDGIRFLLEKTHEIVVVGEAKNGAEALRLVEEVKPDVLVLDMSLPDMSGIAVVEQLQKVKSSTHILILSSFDDEEYIHSVLSKGVGGYLLKEESSETIAAAVRGIARGENGWLSRRVAARMAAWLQAKQEQIPHHLLTEREQEIVRLLAHVKTNEQIAKDLMITERTVRFHLHNIFSKLGVNTRSEVLIWALKEGLDKL